ERAAEDRTTSGFDFLHQRFQLLAIAAAGEHRKTFRGELFGDLGADIIAGADHGAGSVALLHSDFSLHRPCEERSDEAIQLCRRDEEAGLLRFARNDGGDYFPETISSTSRNCSLPKNISLPTKKVGEPNAPRS